MIETWKYLHGQYHVNQMPLQRDTNTTTSLEDNEAEEGELSQEPAKKLKTSLGERLERADSSGGFLNGAIGARAPGPRDPGGPQISNKHFFRT